MLRLVAYSEAMREEWDRFALSRGTVFHSGGFRQILLDSFGYRCAYHAVIDDQERICGLLPLVVGRNLSWSRVGVSLPFVNHLDICADNEETKNVALSAIPGIITNLGLQTVELRLKDQAVDLPQWQVHLQNCTFELPLLEDETATLAQASASCRNHVRKTYKNSWFAVSFDPGRLPEFYKVYVKRMKQLGSPAPALEFFANFFRCMPDGTTLLTVLERDTDRVIGGMLLISDPGNSTLYYPYGANLVEYNHQYLNNFMYWEAVRLGLRQGMKSLDLGRSPVGSGTYHFKMQWGAKPAPLQYLFYGNKEGTAGPPDREKLKVFIELWKVMPAFVTDRIGKTLIKYLMP
ncbi:MAG: FemAB superfamily protein [Firmicutes bacterium]|nr:FemAB superfamily protein [Bacillota bacterium]